MTAANNQSTTNSVGTLYLAFELGWEKWKLAFATQAADNPRLRTLPARDCSAVLGEIAKAKAKLKLPPDAPVVCCYEAGRDGHWLQRYFTAQSGFTCYEVDSSSIEVNRRQRQAKSDTLDAGKLLSMLIRYATGERNVWRVVHVPSVEAEAQRHLHREIEDWTDQRRQHSNRIKGLLATLGHDAKVNKEFPQQLESLRDWSGSPLPEELKARLLRQYEGWQFANEKVKELDKQRSRTIRTGQGVDVEMVRQLLGLKGIGPASAFVFVMEVFGWRKIRNRREIGSLAGLTPTPYASGTTTREQGISKAGNRRLRVMALEIAWCWVQNQPKSELTLWFLSRFGVGQRLRKIGIVAVARKLLVALWKYLDRGEVPKGAELVEWKKKISGWREDANSSGDRSGE
jgi:transposase